MSGAILPELHDRRGATRTVPEHTRSEQANDAERPGAGVPLRSLVVAAMPLLVASLDAADPSGLRDTLDGAGVGRIDGFVGRPLPQGARVGIVIGAVQLRLVDEQDRALLSAPRGGIDRAWLDGARRLKGTMLVLVEALELSPTQDAATLVRLVDAAATEGRARGAVVGVAQDRGSLPLLFG
jgi:hypothetical protein